MDEIKQGTALLIAGARWKVLAVGCKEGDAVYVHLASEEKFVVQRNGKRPVQACGWLRNGVLSSEL